MNHGEKNIEPGQQESEHRRSRVIFEILLVAAPILLLAAAGNVIGLSTIAGSALINLGYVLAIITGGIVLKREGSSWRMIGLAKPANWLTTALSGLGASIAAVAIFVLVQEVVFGLLQALGQAPPQIDESRFNPIEANLPLLLLTITLAWTTIAFGEELFYRAFLISRLVDRASMNPRAAIAASAIIFGAAHFAEGPIGILANGAFGAFFGWIYLRSGRNLWITLIAHGLINTFRFTLLYMGEI